ncbi:MAG TPA: hypothetical protein VES02_00890, partial [Dermatophilaceae bacterium]|nr:hypothetical protein [Dermatophilaceae bacterium]
MLITAVVVPGPPAFVAELMGSAAHELDDLRQAADRAISLALSDLVPASADSPSESVQVVVVGPGEPGEFNAAGPVSFASFGRDVVVPALVEGQRSDRDLPTPIMLARYLASRELAVHPDHGDLWASARWITTSGADAAVLGAQLGEDGARVALILVADGAACHGPKAPRAEDARAQEYDDGVCAALGSGRPGELAQIDADLGDELGATGPQIWPVLVAAAGGDLIGEVLWAGAPYGVGWAVASWRRSAAGAPVN